MRTRKNLFKGVIWEEVVLAIYNGKKTNREIAKETKRGTGTSNLATLALTDLKLVKTDASEHTHTYYLTPEGREIAKHLYEIDILLSIARKNTNYVI